MSPKIFIIIVTYNGLKWLPRCLGSTRPYSVIVVDNGSTDGTVDYISENWPDIKIIPQKKNLGFGQANNIGISFAYNLGAEYVFLLNQDAYLKENCIDTLLELNKRNPEYGVLSPIHLNGNGERLDQKFSQYINYFGNRNFYSDYVLNKTKKEIYQVPFVNAAGWLLSKECIEKVGGFDPIFFHYGEDVNYCQRVNFHNFQVGVAPKAFLFHDRENRSEPKHLSEDSKKLESVEKFSKLNYADINKPLNSDLDNLISKRKKAWIKTSLKLNFGAASNFKKEYQMFRRIKSEVVRSRKINESQNLNYLQSKEI